MKHRQALDTPPFPSNLISQWPHDWCAALPVRPTIREVTRGRQLACLDATTDTRDPPLIGAPFLRPAIASRAVPAVSVAAVRYSSNVPAEEPKKKAQSIIDALPGNSLLSKSAILSSGTALSIYALSNEYYVMNEETVVAVCLLAVWGSLIKYGGPGYKAWAEAQNEKIKSILNSARADHTEAVKTRIDDVKQMSGVVDITKDLFAVSKVSCWKMRGVYRLQVVV